VAKINAIIVALVLLSGLLLGMLTACRTLAHNQGTTTPSHQELRVENAGLPPSSTSSTSTDEEGASEQDRVADVLLPGEPSYEKLKARANAKAQAKQPSGGEGMDTSSLATQATRNVLNSFEGGNDSSQRSDSNGAIGPNQYIEVTNTEFAIYDRSNSTPNAQDTLENLTGQSGHIFDPMMMWDPDTQRFYYSTADKESDTDKRIDFGFSKTSTPSSAADFCKYTIPLGSIHADFPRLGDTENFLLIATNNSDSGYIGSYLYSVAKPVPSVGSSCPDASTFPIVNQTQPLTDPSGTDVYDPVPANQVDGSGTGWVVARAGPLPASKLTIYKVDEGVDYTTPTNPKPTLDLSKVTPKDLSVPNYNLPADAPQPDTKTLLDTLDAGPTQAVSAIDPSQNNGAGAVALWVQHTVFGASGAGAEVRWYEIDPTTPALFQSGKQSDFSGLYYFNAAISPDRMNDGQTQQFGDSMVLTFNSSSTKQYPDIRMVSKEGSGSVSAEATIKPSLAAETSVTGCTSSLCHWGDYPGASSDPAASSTGSYGQVWLTNMWVKSADVWGTWNWAATP
jgi:hypothetical protein